MFKTGKKLLILLLTAVMLSGFFVFEVGAVGSTETAQKFKSYNTEIVCIAHRGDWHSYPENSAEAVRSAAEYGVVSVDIKITSDKAAVLMADSTTDRMCVDKNGRTVSGNVGDFTLAELKEMYLRAANGTEKNEATDFRPASLEDAISAAGDETALMLNLTCADFQTVYTKVKELDALEKVIFRFSDNNKTILATTQGIDDICCCGNYQGNIVFLAADVIKKCRDNKICTVELGSKNGNGVLYDNYLMKRFSSGQKAMVSMVGGRCGKRTDDEKGWDDLISRGYSVIETDHPHQLNEYIKRTVNARAELERCVGLVGDTNTKPFTSDTEKDFISALDNAEAALKKASPLSGLESASLALQSSYDNLTVGEKKVVTLAFDLTPGRIIAFILCGAAILVSQILLYKRRDKKN